MNGPGKYDDLCTHVREATGADAVVLIVLNGSKGSGFSVQVIAGTPLELPKLLEQVAAAMRDPATPKN